MACWRAAAARASMYGWITCAAGNGLNEAFRLSQCVPSPSRTRAKSRGRPRPAGARRTGRTALRTRGWPGGAARGQERGGDAALRRPSRVQELRCGAIDPAFQDAGAKLPQMPAARAVASASSPSRRAGEVGRRRTARTARWDESRAGGIARARRCRRGRRLRCRARWPRSDRAPDTGRVSASASAAATAGLLMCTIDSLWVSSYSSAWGTRRWRTPPSRRRRCSPEPNTRQGPGGEIATAAARVERPRRVRAGERQADDVQHPELRRFDDVRGQIVEREARCPGAECRGQRFVWGHRMESAVVRDQNSAS